MNTIFSSKIRMIGILVLLLTISLSSFSQDSLQVAVAEKGDGILSLLRKHGIDPYNHFDDFVALNTDNIRDGIHLYEGRNYRMPKVKLDTISTIDSVQVKKTEIKKVEEKTFSIFGEDYSTVLTKSNRLKGTVYYLISGHGGPDPGAMARQGSKSISEDEYAYDVTLRLARELLSHEAMVYIIIRDEDDGIRDDRILEMDNDEVAYPNKTISLNQTARLRQRVEIVNKLYRKNKDKYQRLIVTHVDSRSEGQNIDVFFYYHEKSKNGKKLAENIHKTFAKKYKKYQPNRTYSGTFEDRTSLYLVKKTHPAMTFIEIGNIRNKKDQRRILDPDNRQALAKWISEGVLLDYED